MRVRMIIAGTALAAATTVGLAPVASAQPQRGLVNVLIEDVNVQVPIGVAANVCGVSVAVLAALPPGAQFTDCDSAVLQDLPVAFQP